MYKFLLRAKHEDGGFCLDEGGEKDIRGAYCAIAVATILNIADEKLFDKTAEWLIGYFSFYVLLYKDEIPSRLLCRS